jgi:RHS repeat-associated protein
MSSEENFQMPESRLNTTETDLFIAKTIKAKTIILTLLFLLVWLAQSTFAQAPPNSTTRSAYQANAAGSYQLSGFDNINFFNGNLSVNLPLATVGGRGDANFAMILSLGNIGWHVDVTREQEGTCYPSNICNYQNYFTPRFGGDSFKAGLGPGGMKIVQTGSYFGDCNGNTPVFSETLTTITFAMPGDSTVELRDEAYDGKPLPAAAGCSWYPVEQGRSRGTVFKAHDGSGMTFVSDTVIRDYWRANDFLRPSGNLYLKNGVRYRIDNGGVTRITDRNGNWTNFATTDSNYVATDSLGRTTTVTNAIDSSATTITTKRQNNETRTIRIRYFATENECQPLTYGQAFSWFNGATREPQAGQYIGGCYSTKIELPDGRFYRIKFNQYSEISRIELPTGGAIEYDWGSGYFTPHGEVLINASDLQHARGFVYRRVTERRVYDNGASGANYTSKMTISGGTVKEYVAGNPNPISRTDHFYYGDPMSSFLNSNPYYNEDWRSGKEYQTDVYSGDGAQLLRRVQNTFVQRAPVSWYCQWRGSPCPANLEPMNDPRLIETATTLADSNQVSKQTFRYDGFNNQTDTYEYDFGDGAPPSTWKRHTHTDYLTTNPISGTDYTATNIHLKSLPLRTWIAGPLPPSQNAIPVQPTPDGTPDPTGTPTPTPVTEYFYSRTDFEYDNYAGGGSNAPLFLRTNIVGHDTATYNANYATRGNLTKTTTYGNASNQSEPISSYANYDILGNVVKTYDAKGFISTIDYTDRFGAPDNEARSNTAPTQLNGQSTFAFPTSSTNALGWVIGYAQFDYFTGAAVNTEDINGVISKTVYNDLLDRQTQSVSAIGTVFEQQSNTIYDDSNHRVETKSDLNALNDNLLKSESFYDGLGRTIEARKYESDGGYIASKSIPFVMATDPETGILRVGAKVSNPYRPNAGEQPIWTTELSDALGRSIKTITPDGAIFKTEYSGNLTTVTDQAGKKRRSVTNALGQLMRVDEPDDAGLLDVNNAPVQSTNYSYDTLNNLTTVSQGVQTRSFVYDSLSRLKSATNPESGLIQYSYDNNGNLTQKTDARAVVTNYIYDNLNRVTARNYSAPANLPNYQTTPSVVYTYDDPTVTFSKGRLTKVSSSLSETRYTQFDNIGRILTSQQMTDGQTYNSSYVYNLSGALIEETYPSGRVIKNTLNADGDLQLVQSRKANDTFRNYANSFNYTAAGAVSSLRLGNGRWENTTFNSRLQPIQIGLGSSATSQNLLKLNFDYGGTDNNGNVKSQQIVIPTIGANTGFTATQTYTYDSLNRIKDAKEMIGTNQQWKQTFTFDRYGNRRFDEANTTTLTPGCQTAVCNPTIDPATNKLIGYQFDSSGNTKIDANGQTFTYDAENKQVEVRNTSNGIVGQYFYDGDGKRIKKYVPSTQETTIFVYDASGKMVAEYSTAATSQQDAKVSYLTSDHLGSPRINTDQNGQVIARHDYQPFGEEITRASYGADSTRQKFTSYERDNESGLDFAQARMFGNSIGRFTSPDPILLSLRRDNPQTLNRYTYVLNNPLNLVDPLGLWEIQIQIKYKTKKGKDGNEVIDTDRNGKQIVDRVKIVAVKTKSDDNGASLAKQLGLNGDEAKSFDNEIGSGDNVQLSGTKNEAVSSVYGNAEKGITDESESQRKDGKSPEGPNCAGVSCSVGGLGGNRKQYLDPEGFGNSLDSKVKKGKAEQISEDSLRVGDIARYATSDGKAKHFANFVFRNDDGVPIVFSKSGFSGPYQLTTARSLEGNHPGGVVYGNINGYFRGVKKP